MGKKKGQRGREQQQEVKNEIDYSSLAHAIVSAQKRANSNKNTHSKNRIRLMRFLNGTIYISCSIGCVYGIIHLWRGPSSGAFSSVVTKIILSLVLGAMSIWLFLSQQESLDESSEESKEHFTANLSLVALIVAIIALLKEFN